MIYISKLTVPSQDKEDTFFVGKAKGLVMGEDAITKEEICYTDYNAMRTCYSSIYPFGIFREKDLMPFSFSDITLFCGSNGSGKSTLLNVIAEKLKLDRMSSYNTTAFMKPYVDMTFLELSSECYNSDVSLESLGQIITSDDVFNHMLISREKNERMDFMRERMFNRIAEYKAPDNIPREVNFENPESVAEFKRHCDARSMSQSKYVKKHLGMNEKLHSNGESGFLYFTEAIKPNGLYLLDEPENSLSVQLQIQLVEYIELMARFYNCQFIIATHSVFIQSIHNALVYNLDDTPVATTKWSDLPNVKLYYDFFKKHEMEFIKDSTTGLSRLTEYYKPGSLNIIAGRPAMGKTTFVVNLAIELNKPVAYFSLEKSVAQLYEVKGFDNNELIFVDDTRQLKIEDCQQRIRQMKKEHDIQMVIVDYLQLMSVDLPKKSKTNRNDEVKIIVKGLKTIAEELQIPVVATSQLSRIVETRDDFRPCLDDLSNEISKLDFVDDVRLLYRPSYYGLYKKNDYDDIMEVIASERNYGLGTIELSFERNKQPLYQEVNFIPIVK